MFKLNAAYVSITIPLLIYLVFICIILKFSIPLKSHMKRSDLTSIWEFWKKKKSDNRDNIIQFQETNQGVPPVQLLTVIFSRADEDKDNLLSVHELADYIHKRTTDHIDSAMQENYSLFMSIDTNPRNGVISWREYHEYFLQKHGIDSEYIKKHTERHQGLGRSLKGKLNYRQR
ncbi:hypothetical protein O3M35_002198 [Rhynocoris fuscipes]|uniref:EF-hand domain-containing protein n=1 Tax=Rhynocoris fuscipes TaxID=488301 RepID=A0AAW1CXS5_9HEMI